VGGQSQVRGHNDDSAESEGRFSLNDVNDELTIRGVSPSDASTYSCRAFNSVGAATRTYTLIVQGSYSFLYQHVSSISCAVHQTFN